MENSPLHKLSAELVNNIAHMVLYHEGGVTIGGKDSTKHAAALVQTCRAMRKDYTTLYFHNNNFTYVANDLGFVTVIDKFLGTIGDANVKALGSIDVVLRVAYDQGLDYMRKGIEEYRKVTTSRTSSRREAPCTIFFIEMASMDGTVTRRFCVDTMSTLGWIKKAKEDLFVEVYRIWNSKPPGHLDPEQLAPFGELNGIVHKLQGICAVDRVARQQARRRRGTGSS